MKSFSVATNFDSQLIRALGDYPVVELYGKLPEDIVGGGRSRYMVTSINKRTLAKHVAEARQAGIGFNYLLNAACLDNLETTKSGQKNIRSLLDWICSIDASAVTVSNPLLLRIIKKSYPNLRVRVSVFAGVDHLRKAQYWQDIGADVICLDSLTVNRDFSTLRTLKQSLICELELLVNNNCLQSCSLSQCHMNLLAHSSQRGHRTGGFVIDHCILECSKMKVHDPVNYLRSDWIRPEDLHHYEDLGYSRFKIVERGLPTEVMVNRIKAYTQGVYHGNLLDLIQPYGQKQNASPNSWWQQLMQKKRFLFLLNPFKVNITKLKPLMELSQEKGMLVSKGDKHEEDVYIDNQLLDGFIDRFISVGCRNVDCNVCQHCHRYTKKALRINDIFKKRCLDLHGEIDHLLESGKMFT